MEEPISVPMGVIDTSTPRVNKPMPKISRMAPKIKEIRTPLGTGANVKLSTKTIRVMGKTEDTVSLIFSVSWDEMPMGSTSST